MDLIKTGKILEEFGSLKLRGERPETFVEIAGLSRREMVFSDMLAYFLDPGKPHGLESLLLETFCEIAGESNLGRSSENVEVQCEVPTESKKRIDLLVETEELVLLIENKIDARTNNPFDEYARHLDEISEGREQIRILLTVNPSNAGSDEGFVNLTYSKLVNGLESKLGKYAAEADARLLTFFLDFMNTMDNLKRGTRMDPKLIELFADKQGELEELLGNFQSVKQEMKSKTQELQNVLDFSNHRNVNRRYDRPVYGVYEDLIYDVALSEGSVITVETSIFPQGWEIWIWNHTGDYEQIQDLSKLRKILKKLEIPVEEWTEDWGFLHELSYCSRSQLVKDQDKYFSYNVEISEVAKVVQKLVDDLCSPNAV